MSNSNRTVLRIGVACVLVFLVSGWGGSDDNPGVPSPCGFCANDFDLWPDIRHSFGGSGSWHFCTGPESAGCHMTLYWGSCADYHNLCFPGKDDDEDSEAAAALELAHANGDVKVMARLVQQYDHFYYVAERAAIQVGFFRDTFDADSSYQVQAEALRAIGRSGDRDQLDFLRRAAETDSPRNVIRSAAEWAIEEISNR